jgi:hypothetical protein
VGVELFHEDGRTDGHDEANSRFSRFANAPTNIYICMIFCEMLQRALGHETVDFVVLKKALFTRIHTYCITPSIYMYVCMYVYII